MEEKKKLKSFLFLICLFFIGCDNKNGIQQPDGLEVTIQAQEESFYPNQTVTVTVELVNNSSNLLSCDANEDYFEIEVDGEWYQWGGPLSWDTQNYQVKPNQILHKFAQISLTEKWVSKEIQKPLILDVGSHTLRFRFSPKYIKPYRSDAKPVRATFKVTSNLLDIKIIPQK